MGEAGRREEGTAIEHTDEKFDRNKPFSTTIEVKLQEKKITRSE